jgi:hypothetical protein
MELADKKRYCQIIGRILLIDAEITDTEHDFLEQLMDRLGLSEGEKESIVDGLDADEPIADSLAAMAPAARSGLMDDARAAANADGMLGPRELALIAELEAALA